MAITLPEALYLLRALNVETVRVEDLITTFLQQATKEETTKGEEEQELPELPPAPEPPKEKEEATFKTYNEAKKAAKKGQKPVKNEAGEWVVM